MKLKQVLSILICLALTGKAAFTQTKEIYTNPEFHSLAKDHQVLAILPFDVVLQLRPNEMKNMRPGDLEQLQQREGDAVQSALHTYFLKQKEKEDFKVTFQDIGKTNVLLKRKGWTADSLKLKTKEEIAEALEVDGLISGALYTNKPMSEGASAAFFIARSIMSSGRSDR